MIVSVVPLRPVAKPYSYRVPANEKVSLGQIVRIPFGNKKEPEPTLGVVWALDGQSDAPDKLKSISAIEDLPPFSTELRQFLDWSAQYTLSPIGMFARMALPLNDVTRHVPTQTRYSLTGIKPVKLTAARQRILDLMTGKKALTRKEIKDHAKVSDSVISVLIKEEILTPVTVKVEALFSGIDVSNIKLPLYDDAQASAAQQLENSVTAADFSVTLLDGVTGSGKTEVYFAAVKQALSMGRQALILVPEIALTNQFVERFTKRFGVSPVTWHSHLTPAQRRRNIKAILSGQAQVILGARSALFLPHPRLGLIVIDEEHDSSYKQEEGVYYNARDLAIKRAQIEKFPVVLVSATPSLETYHHAQTGKYAWVKLASRFAAAQMPQIDIVDMRAEKIRRTQFLSPTLLKAMHEALDQNQQVMLYLNRRGYAPLTLCRTCGHRIECPRCTAWLVQHRTHGGLMCHHCGWQAAPPKNCPACNVEDSLVPVGPGVERIEDEVKLNFPNKRVAILSSDTQKSMATLAETLEKIENKQIDIMIGTQIMAKGHHFPLLTLVGVVDADLGLGGGDLRASERTFQILQQVAGRAGRGEHPGRVLLQSFMPEHRVIQTLTHGQRDAFLAVEMLERQDAGMPPSGRLAALIVSSKDEEKARRFAEALGHAAPNADAIRVLGPAPAPLFKVRLNYRFRLLVKTERDQNIQKYITEWLSHIRVPAGVRVQVDIDPYSFM